MLTRYTTGRGLSADAAFVGLVDYGLFAEKLPPYFTSEGLSGHVPQDLMGITTENRKRELTKLLKNKVHDYIRYEALLHVKVFRPIGIPHPESHLVQCLALKRHWKEIVEHCARPLRPASRLFVRRLRDKRVFEMNYRARDRYRNDEADIWNRMGAHFLVKTDISNCFPSIYTHSIPWALHGLDQAKRNREVKLPGNLLDRTTQGTRDGQTNGIIIGPHTSNVISEIILTKIDFEMNKKGFKQFTRHIDDYEYPAKTYKEAEDFIREIGMQMREYELVLNERKTEILPLPIPREENWIRELNRYQWSSDDDCIHFGEVSSFMDLALDLAHAAENLAVLNYAIKMVPSRLNDRAKRLFVQQAANLALLYPYLASLLEKHVFDKHPYDGIAAFIRSFNDELLDIGVQKIQSDAISHALFYSLKHNVQFSEIEKYQEKIVEIDDCISLVLLFEYAKLNGCAEICEMIIDRANELRGLEMREKDRYWLLIYQVWCEKTLECEDQPFLAELKRRGLSFVRPHCLAN